MANWKALIALAFLIGCSNSESKSVPAPNSPSSQVASDRTPTPEVADVQADEKRLRELSGDEKKLNLDTLARKQAAHDEMDSFRRRAFDFAVEYAKRSIKIQKEDAKRKADAEKTAKANAADKKTKQLTDNVATLTAINAKKIVKRADKIAHIAALKAATEAVEADEKHRAELAMQEAEMQAVSVPDPAPSFPFMTDHPKVGAVGQVGRVWVASSGFSGADDSVGVVVGFLKVKPGKGVASSAQMVLILGMPAMRKVDNTRKRKDDESAIIVLTGLYAAFLPDSMRRSERMTTIQMWSFFSRLTKRPC